MYIRRNNWCKNLLIVCFAILVGFPANAQFTQKTFGHPYNNICNSFTKTIDGGYAIIGAYDVERLFTPELNMIKLDSLGLLQWSYTYGQREDKQAKKKDGSGNGGYGILQTSDSGYILAGETHGFGSGGSDVYVVRINSEGDTVWSYAYGGSKDDYGYSVVQGFDENFLVAGYTESFGAGIRDGYLIMLDETGDTLWTRTLGGKFVDGLFKVIQTKDSCYLTLGYTLENGLADIMLTKVDRIGTILWTYSYGGDLNDFGNDILPSSDGGFVIVGNTESFGAGFQDVCILKISEEGIIEWAKCYGGEDYETANSLDYTRDGYVVVGHTTSFGSGWEDIYMLEIDQDGDTIETMTFGDFNRDIGKSVSFMDGDYLICGNTLSFGLGYDDIYLIKVDSTTNKSCYLNTTRTMVNIIQISEDSLSLEVGYGGIKAKTQTIVGKTRMYSKFPCKAFNSIGSQKQLPSINFNVSPNPCEAQVIISINEPYFSSFVSIQILDVYGKLIESHSWRSGLKTKLQVGHLKSGLYFMQMDSGRSRQTKRFYKL